MEVSRENKLSCVGTYASSCYFLSFCLPFIDLFHGDIKYDETPGIMILANYFCCGMWYLYGDLIESPPIRVNYLACYICSALLLFIYLCYEFRYWKADAILNLLIIICLSFIIWKGFKIFGEDQTKIFYSCLVGNGLVYLAPIQIIYRVIKEYKYHLIPIHSPFISLIACVTWTLYAYYNKGFEYLAIPKGLGILVSIIMIVVWFNYRKKVISVIGSKEGPVNVISVGEEKEGGAIGGDEETPVKIHGGYVNE